MRSVGLDFGTTNTALGVADGSKVALASFRHASGAGDTFRSVLYFHPEARDLQGRLQVAGGGEAIDRYLAAEGTGRLMQSLKSYLADDGFQSTNIFHRHYTLPDLLALLLAQVRLRGEEVLGPLGAKIVVGRPVHFAHARVAEDEALAVARLTEALGRAGFTDVTFEYEPVAAAYYYESRLDHDEVVLIADFGGGTSDFSLVRVGPGQKHAGASKILGTDGVGLAGDALDARLVDHVVAPALGKGASYKAMFGRDLPVPVWIYARLRRWHHLSFLKSKKTMDMLREIATQSDEPEPIEAFIHLLEDDLGFHLYRAVERTKVALSSQTETRFHFADEPVTIDLPVKRADFEQWIADELGAIAGCVDGLLARVGLTSRDVDRVFMTGGTSFVPAVRAIFETRFGREKLVAGGEMISVATGLALRAAEPD